jgi:hypothetical protein
LEPSDRIISLMYEAAVNPALWTEALEAIAAGVHAASADLTVFDKRAMEPRFLLIAGAVVPEDVIPPYAEYYWNIDPLMPSVATQPASDTVMLCQEFVSSDTAAKSEYYQDFLNPNLGGYRAGWHLENNADTLIALGFHRGEKRFERSELSAWEPLARHARNAAGLLAQIGPVLARGELMRQAFDHRQIACIMVDSKARVLDC